MPIGITTTDLVEAAVTALKADSTLNDWLDAQFDQSLAVYLGEDVQDSSIMRHADCPWIVVGYGPHTGGFDQGSWQFTVSIDWALVNETVTTSGRHTTYPGLAQLETMGRYIVDALEAAYASTNAWPSRWQWDPPLIEDFPMFSSFMEVAFDVPDVLGTTVTL